jgi:tetratricopeptide (TPR) repeat protein
LAGEVRTGPPEAAEPGAVLVAEAPGSRIGPYKLLQSIGEGGMGSVFMAEQTQPVRRLVAFKIVRPDMDSRRVVARFEAERQALALMDHPNIARVLDGGTTDSGRPYFVMELVKGVPITRYCDEHRLTPRQRVELFVSVCQAVQHAHQKGIIHRDLKPTNVLVACYDGKPVPKVIDFGVAKATGPRLTERTLYTEFGQVVGTLEYMSPEQAELNQLDVDTRSDVYALGVLLYELLTGTTPLSRERVKETALLEVLRLIREEEPPKPSTRLSITAEVPMVAAGRGIEPKKLSGLVRGELDWVVMRALEKDRNRRYQSAGTLAQDLIRYLRDEPVEAGPPGAGYRLRKLARRYQKALILAGAFVALLVAGALVSAGLAVRAWQAERTARAAQTQAETNLRQAHQAVNDYFTMVSESTLLNEPTLEPLRQQLLEAALRYYRQFAREHEDDPALQAELAATYFRISVLMHDLGDDNDWLPMCQKMVAIVDRLLRQQADVAAFQSLRQGIYRVNTTPHGGSVVDVHVPDEVLQTIEKARTLWQALVRADPTAPGFRNDLAVITNILAGCYYGVGRAEEGLRCQLQAAALWRQLARDYSGVPHYRAALAMVEAEVSIWFIRLGQSQKADEPREAALKAAKQLVADFPDVPAWREFLHAFAYEMNALTLNMAGRLREAEAAYRAAIAGEEALLRDYPLVSRYRRLLLGTQVAFGDLLWDAGRATEAAKVYADARSLGETMTLKDVEGYALHAKFLATCPDPQIRDSKRAMRMAKQLLDQLPDNASYWLLLGESAYLTGDHQGAIRALLKETDMPTGGSSFGKFYLAMAHWHLGHAGEAHRWYDQAMKQLEKFQSYWGGELRLRAEAEKLLGVMNRRQ